jgi:hypothetical protein
MNNQKMLDVLRYWHIEEYLLPQSLEEPLKLENENQQSFTGNLEEIESQIQKLQHQNNFNSGENNYVWEFVVYGGIYKIEKIKDILLTTLNVKDDYEERVQKGQAASYALMFNSQLKFKIGELQISTAPWAIRDIVKNKKITQLDYVSFQSLEDKLKEEFNEKSILDSYEFKSFIQGIDDELKNVLDKELRNSDDYFQVVAKRKMRKNIDAIGSDIDLLNSFYIDDLKKTIQFVNNGNTNKLLNQYLEMDEKDNRKDVRQEIEYVYDILAPDKLPDSCWATTDGHPLVYSQQFAINSIRERLLGNGGIYAVNGPPGTGKTTMLRDLIAFVITERAKEIAKLEYPQDMFAHTKADKAWKNNDNQQWYRKLKSEFLGHEIVVASSNNGAVENITKEIPSVESIDKKWLKDIDYFADLGSRLIGEDAWGSGAACLGNSKNKNSFVSNFWYGSKNKENVDIESFGTYLKKIINSNERTEETLHKWKDAKMDFLEAVHEVQRHKKEKMAIKNLPNDIQKQIKSLLLETTRISNMADIIKKKIEELTNNINEFNKTIDRKHQSIIKLETIGNKFEENYKSLLHISNELKAKINELFIRKPSIIDIIFSLGKSWKQWNSKKDVLEEDEDKLKVLLIQAQKEIALCKSEIQKENMILSNEQQKQRSLIKEAKSFQDKLSEYEKELKNLKLQHEKQEQRYKEAIQTLYKEEKRNSNEEEREKASPWTHDKHFQDARTNVFIKALNLHKAQIDANANTILLNLLRIIEVLGNKVKQDTQHQEAIRHAWATLFLCVPVVSTTFASFGRLFSQLWDSKIGWLLIDEAGQASAKSAVGAIMRSQRAVVVGDPLQLEPIIGLPGSVQDILHKEIHAHDEAFSEHTSVQKRADFTEISGTYLESNEGKNTWVGSPLRVHRRCHSPMFDIANITTYKGLMVQGKGNDNSLLPRSQWIDVPSMTNSGHWIEDEGNHATSLVSKLQQQGISKDDIYLISPFRDVVNGLKNIFNENKLIDTTKRVGTIHTVQGKEAKVVILVLGSDPNNDGARLWAAAKPNLLNVAATRAKDRLYIIGNKSKWKDKQYFKDAIQILANS